MNKIKIAIIGFGGMGSYHYQQLKKLGLYEVLGVFDVEPKANEKAAAYGLKVYGSYDEVLADSSIDAVLISCPNEAHHDYTIRAAAAKKHILCEKPVTMGSVSLAHMIKATDDAGVVFMVNQNRRQDKDFVIIQEVLGSGDIGKVYKIESNVMSSHGIPGGWRKQRERGGGMILDWGVHLIDQALMAIPQKVVKVYCKNSYIFGHEVDDGCDIRLTFADGTDTKIYIDTNSFCPLPRWVVYGENGSAILKKWVVLFAKGSVICVRERVDTKNKGIRAGNGFTKTMADRSKSSLIKKRLPCVKADGCFIYKSFFAAIQNGEEPVIKNHEIMRVMQVMEACFVSDRKGQVIDVDI